MASFENTRALSAYNVNSSSRRSRASLELYADSYAGGFRSGRLISGGDGVGRIVLWPVEGVLYYLVVISLLFYGDC
jgi:hypothetical protein